MHQRDGARIVELVRAEPVLVDGEAFQLIEDGLIAALTDKVEGAAEAAADCAGRLRGRGWPSDDELG